MLKIGKEPWEKLGFEEEKWKSFSKEKQKAIISCSRNGHNIKNHLDFNDDIDVVTVAVQHEMLAYGSETALSFASERLKNDERVVFEAVKCAGVVLDDANPRFQNSDKYIELAVAEEPAAICCASEEKQNDPDFLKKLSEKYPKVVKFIRNREIKENIKNESKKNSTHR